MSKESFIQEARIMHQLYHCHILPLLGVCIDEDSIVIVTELMSKGALIDVLRSEEGRDLTLDQIIDMAAQVRHWMIMQQLLIRIDSLAMPDLSWPCFRTHLSKSATFGSFGKLSIEKRASVTIFINWC